ncbi:MAG TPA: hypothetical protein VLQ45_30320 [Thermoanaerobaculia bacterium]|nr:hypothetical protein [Thermoanaerobaculia bacterium]
MSVETVAQFRSHGMVIDWREAREMGLKVSFLETDDPLWRQLWSLFLAYHIESATKIFETRKVSLAW